jgi:guanylate kinase
LINRKTEGLEVIEKRIAIGKKEYDEIRNSIIYNLIIENNEIEASYKAFKDGVLNLYSDVLKI